MPERLFFCDSFSKLNTSIVDEFQTKLGAKLPDDYTSFLIQKNGGLLAATTVIVANEDEIEIERFASLTDEFPPYSIDFLRDRWLAPHIPDGLPIALTPSSEFFALRLGDINSVHLADPSSYQVHESIADCELVADSFSDFFNDLVIAPNWLGDYGKKYPPFGSAILTHDLNRLETFCKANICEFVNFLDQQPFVLMSVERSPLILETLLRNGLDPNHQFKNNTLKLEIPIISSVETSDAIGILISYGANLETRCSRGMTPLHHAISQGRYSVVKALVLAGADLDAKTANGESIYDLIPLRRTYYAPKFIQLLITPGEELENWIPKLITGLESATSHLCAKALIAVLEKHKLGNLSKSKIRKWADLELGQSSQTKSDETESAIRLLTLLN